jgi:RNA polymerase sigma factor (sigma-70 family)
MPEQVTDTPEVVALMVRHVQTARAAAMAAWRTLYRRRGAYEPDDFFSIGLVGLVHAARTYDSIRGRGERAWIWQGVYFEILTATKRRELPRAEMPADVPAEGMTSPEQRAIVNEVVECLAKLPVRLRDVLVRTCVHGESLETVGGDLGVSMQRAGQLRARARDELRAML